MHIDKIIEKDFPVIKDQVSVKEAAEILASENINGLPVLNDKNEVVGFISEYDIIKKALPKYIDQLKDVKYIGDFAPFYKNLHKLQDLKVKDVMTKDIKFLTLKDSVMEAAVMMIEENLNVIPIIENKNLIGIVTRNGIIKLVNEKE